MSLNAVFIRRQLLFCFALVKCGVNLRVATKWGAVSVQAKTVITAATCYNIGHGLETNSDCV